MDRLCSNLYIVLNFHTLNARDNALIHWIFLEVAKGDPSVFRDGIQNEGQVLRNLLSSRGVDYVSLKSALIPPADGRQIAFLYDWLDDDSWNYAVNFAKSYLPHLRPELRTSVFHGDTHSLSGSMPVEAFESDLVKARAETVDWQTQYAVYFSNLRPSDVQSLHAALLAEPRYQGYIDVTFSSQVRDYLAQCVSPLWIINGRKVLMSHGGDEPLVDSEDPVGFDLPKYGYEVVSLIDAYFVGFLSYKIESSNARQSADDRILNLAAITGELIDIRDVDVRVPPDKLSKYLLLDKDKLRLMTNIGLQEITPDKLAEVIRSKLMQNYIYDFRFAPDGTPLFAVAAEFATQQGELTRRLLALKHDKEQSAISLVTMY